LPPAPHQLCFPKVLSVGCSGVRRWAGHCLAVGVTAGRCMREGGQDPFCGSAGIIYDGALGFCMRIRRGQPIECATVESKLFSFLDSPPRTNRQLQPSHACTGIQSLCVLFTDKPTCCRTNWSGDEIAIARAGHSLRLTAGCTGVQHRLYLSPTLHKL